METKQRLVLNENVKTHFTRRRYGNTTFTWLDFELPDDNFISAGDPVQSVIYPKDEITRRFNAMTRCQNGGLYV